MKKLRDYAHGATRDVGRLLEQLERLLLRHEERAEDPVERREDVDGIHLLIAPA